MIDLIPPERVLSESSVVIDCIMCSSGDGSGNGDGSREGDGKGFQSV